VDAPRYRPVRTGGCIEATVERRADGSTLLRSTEPLGPYPQRLTERLEHWADEAPDRICVARRGAGGDWRRVSYAQMRHNVEALAQSLLDAGLSAERPLLILSENDPEHFALSLAAMWAGVPSVPISPAYSLISQDFGKLRHIVATVTPGMVFASGPAYAKAIAATIDPAVPVVLTTGDLNDRRIRRFGALLDATPGAALRAAHAAVSPQTVAKLLFTSGSTRLPKAVTTTQHMLCANQQTMQQSLPFLTEAPPVMVDWLPWNHVFGGSHNVGIALYNGGTLYIDDGKPTAAGIGETLRNLREISPTIYFNVPKGFEEIAAAMQDDEPLRRSLFTNLRAFFYSGAGLSPHVWDQLEQLSERTVGERIPIMTGLGMTEAAPACTFAVKPGIQAGHVGLPGPGVDVKLVPIGGKLEMRVRGPNVMPGYWRDPAQTAEAFDDEGFYCTGDAVRFVDTADPQRGLAFDGRIAEDFKLSTGTFVSVGPLRARLIAAGAPCVQDVVMTGLNRSEVGALFFPRLDECCKLAGLPAVAPASQVLAHPAVRAFFQRLIDQAWREGSGSANRVARAQVLEVPASIDKGEITDKGSINQRAVLTHRAVLVEALYDGSDTTVLAPHNGAPRTTTG